MTDSYIVLLPEHFSAEEHEDEIRNIILDLYSDTDEIEFEFHKRELMKLINDFASDGVFYADQDNNDDLPWHLLKVLYELCSDLECLITTIRADGDGFIVNLREWEEKLNDLL